jgi:putative acetyltransferase
MSGIEVRPARPDDGRSTHHHETLNEYLYRQYPVDEFGDDAVYILDVEALLHPSVTFLAAWQGDQPLGCGAVRRMADGEGAYGEIKRMFVRPDARGQRIGEKLLLSLEDAARSDGIRRLYLETGVRQPEATRLYERCGWRVRGPFGDYPEHPSSVFMEKTL